MLSYRELVKAFQEVGITRSQPVIVHASLSSIGEIRGGAETVFGALLGLSGGVMAPAFTYRTMITPEVGPEDNAIGYGSGKDQNRMAEFFHADMRCDPTMGILSETVRKYTSARRSNHPILSFTGVNVDFALDAQTLEEPLAPIGMLAEQNGVVLLIGVDHSVNTSIHYAEYVAGRKQFTRYALTSQGVRPCPGWPGCSDGFQKAAPHLETISKNAHLGNALITAVALKPMIEIVAALITEDPLALLCDKNDERCETVRRVWQSSPPEGLRN
jgi:aminoglycoside 3-N-acetyltransferase